jgi:hypothetical protein
LDEKSAEGYCLFVGLFVLCSNSDCRKYTLDGALYEAFLEGPNRSVGEWKASSAEPINRWRLVPASGAKVFPDYVPTPIRADYVEACMIRELSPKASATLSRRALQGMIRDFWKISKNRLADEINALRDKVDSTIWDAIDGVRHVGNISAHMEKDIDIIVDVEPEEAGQLIWLIEVLIKDWYINRAEREARLRDLKGMVAAKKDAKSSKAPIEK